MRLLNAKTLEFRERFPSNNIPKYAILSHRWGNAEITFRDYETASRARLQGLRTEDAEHNVGLYKIAGTCAVARQQGLEWIWIDTCCIDKANYTELAESINSMFRWYRQASICFAYLVDVTWDHRAPAQSRKDFKSSTWFTRGWTLQELLAPREVVFFDRHWQFIGTKKTLSAEIAEATNIAPEHLWDFTGASVATRMSWMAQRQTEKEEDVAYSMLGVFNVNMDLRYGEGRGAFQRLQEMILKATPDESIFAWTSDKMEESGLLAPWPDCFKNSGRIFIRPEKFHPRGSCEMTSQGLRFPAPIGLVGAKSSGHCGWMLQGMKTNIKLPLQCWERDASGHVSALVIHLKRTGGDFFRRVDCHMMGRGDRMKMTTTVGLKPVYWTKDIYVSQSPQCKAEHVQSGYGGYAL